jgi:4-methylaminobutanoate oxidase (formaldehyde-forming)
MTQRPDFIVIGGGIFGCSIAWYLARAGAGKVTVVERQGLAAATTSRAAALLTRIRLKPGQTALGTETRRAIEELEEESGSSLEQHRVGSLHIAASPQTQAGLEELAAAAAEHSEPFEWIDPEETFKRIPWLQTERELRVGFMPEDSYLDPYQLAMTYAGAAKARGVEFLLETEVTGLMRSGDRITGVRTAGRDIEAGCVIDAAGPWAGILAAEAGWHLPLAPVRSHYWITAPGPLFPTDNPYVILPDAHAYTRPEVGGLLFGLRDRASLSCDPRELPADLAAPVFPADPEGWDVLIESGPGLQEFFPALAEAELAHYVAAPSTYTPDGQFVLGALPGVSGMLVASGCCGAGIACSGGVGRAIAELATDQASHFELEGCRPDRFGEIDSFSESWRELCAQGRSGKTSG